MVFRGALPLVGPARIMPEGWLAHGSGGGGDGGGGGGGGIKGGGGGTLLGGRVLLSANALGWARTAWVGEVQGVSERARGRRPRGQEIRSKGKGGTCEMARWECAGPRFALPVCEGRTNSQHP